MKRNTIILFTAIAMSAASGIAGAAQSLATVKVNSNTIVDCTPPNDLAVCSAFHAQIRGNFSVREIGMLFGAATSYPESLTSQSRLQQRYRAMSQEFAAVNHVTVKIAAK